MASKNSFRPNLLDLEKKKFDFAHPMTDFLGSMYMHPKSPKMVEIGFFAHLIDHHIKNFLLEATQHWLVGRFEGTNKGYLWIKNYFRIPCSFWAITPICYVHLRLVYISRHGFGKFRPLKSADVLSADIFNNWNNPFLLLHILVWRIVSSLAAHVNSFLAISA